ncbi:zinc finger protein BALDIBIS-like [Lotus japonicus]|uniref:zinc finger protein BALDIBIS-like n=1 Tax=Lotus japonicus TaxID=34305 RepID=UPI002589BE40|nr:zinc finger protein BALDIBIS-like [Lotus japonicus]
MEAPFSEASFHGITEEDQKNQNNQQHYSSTPSSSRTPPAPHKKRRNQPGTPYPDAEVIALSPKTLMATNRFICEVCNKGFQREQNLQLHRRGHNLPWKLKQKNSKDQANRKVYLCPEPTCVHHDPSRALGDLTGIKKHFSRKHGEKKWKCEKCPKKYAVQSDWKAHSKTCGTKEYRCDCGTLFSRRDSFITHRAFCDAPAQENNTSQPPNNMSSAISSQLYGSSSNNNHMSLALSQMCPQIHHQTNNNNQSASDLLHFGGANIAKTEESNHNFPSTPSLGFSFKPSLYQTPSSMFFMPPESNQNQNYHHFGGTDSKPFQGLIQLSELHNNNSSFSEHFNIYNIEGSSFFSEGTCSVMGDHHQHHQFQTSSTTVPSLFSSTFLHSSNITPHLSATAMLQKAAQMAASSSNNTSSSSDHKPNYGNMQDQMMNSSIFGASDDHDYGLKEEEPKHLQKMMSAGGSERLSTRDFLGVGQDHVVRSLSEGVSEEDPQQQQQHGFFNLSSLEAERNGSRATGQCFGDGGNFQ